MSTKKVLQIKAIDNENRFIESVYTRLTNGSTLYRALKNKSFATAQRNFHFSEVSEDFLAIRAKQNLGLYSPLPFLIASELLTALNLYKVTREERFFSLLVTIVGALIQERDINYGYVDSLRQKVGNGWGCNFIVAGQWTYDLATTCAIAFPIILFVAECIRNSNKYIEDLKIQSYINVCRQIADDFLEDVIEIDGKTFVKQPGMADVEPSNHVAGYINLLLMVYFLTKEKSYCEIAGKLAETIKQSFRDEDDSTICWPYRANALPKRSTFGERYWKSPWIIATMMLCERFGLVFTEKDLKQVVHTVKTNLLRNGQVYDSLSKRAGVLVNDERIAYHRMRGQTLSMQRLINFAPLAIIETDVQDMLEHSIMNHNFYRNFVDHHLNLENYWTLEGLSFFLDPGKSIFNFKELI